MSNPTQLRAVLAVTLSLFACSFMPARARAQTPDAASLLSYGFTGFTAGAEIGLAVGYIATGPVYRDDEWRKLVLGAGIGALAGMSTGILAAIGDAAGGGAPTGFYIVRDAGYGAVLGAAMGAVVGCLLWVDHGSTKDVLKGAAFGTVFGSVAGAGYGILESNNAMPRRDAYGMAFGPRRRFHLAISPSPYSRGVSALLTTELD